MQLLRPMPMLMVVMMATLVLSQLPGSSLGRVSHLSMIGNHSLFLSLCLNFCDDFLHFSSFHGFLCGFSIQASVDERIRLFAEAPMAYSVCFSD
jgi:hypothetical protein